MLVLQALNLQYHEVSTVKLHVRNVKSVCVCEELKFKLVDLFFLLAIN